MPRCAPTRQAMDMASAIRLVLHFPSGSLGTALDHIPTTPCDYPELGVFFVARMACSFEVKDLLFLSSCDTEGQ